MTLGLFNGLNARPKPTPRSASSPFRPSLEQMEDRCVPATLGGMNLPIEVVDLNVIGEGADQQLEAVVSLAGQATDTILIDIGTEAVAGEECPILHLELGPIDLNLLGLQVETSQICLDVTATNHEGLLGGLLCDLTGGLDLGGILVGIGDQLDNLLDQVDSLLDDILGGAFNVTSVLEGGQDAAIHQVGGSCDILNLELGPIDLDVPLLGVSVGLDDCEGGPVTIDVTGHPEDGLLGQVLCGLAGGIDLGVIDVDEVLDRIDNLIDRLTDLADRISDLPDLGRRVTQVTDNLVKFAEQVDSLADLDRFLDRVDKAIDKVDKILDRL